MSSTDNKTTSAGQIPDLTPVPWGIAVAVSWAGLRRRLSRALITMSGIILAIAFLAYMLITEEINKSLIVADNDQLNVLLQRNGVDILTAGGTDDMTILLISLALLTCLVGIINSMLMSVTERVREIGTLKCLGALDTFIVKTFFIESSLQGIIGTLIGMILGSVVVILLSLVSYGTYVFQYFPLAGLLKSLLITFIIGTLISVLASIAPAYLAARKQPVEAMRVEE